MTWLTWPSLPVSPSRAVADATLVDLEGDGLLEVVATLPDTGSLNYTVAAFPIRADGVCGRHL